MAARPNPLRALIDAQQVAKTQSSRLQEMLKTAQAYLAANENTLTVEERSAYHTCIMLGRTQEAQYSVLSGMSVPMVGPFAKSIPLNENGQPKRRGRPSKAAATVEAAPKKRGRKAKAKEEVPVVIEAKVRKTKAKAEPVVEAAPKKRGRPKKVVAAAAVAEAPKKRGRPKKAVAAAAVTEAPKKRGRPKKAVAAAAAPVAPKKRGRPKAQAAAVAPTGKKRGRPPGSKNKVKTEGQLLELQAQQAALLKEQRRLERLAKNAQKAEDERKKAISEKRLATRAANKAAKAAPSAAAAGKTKKMKQPTLPGIETTPAVNAAPLSDNPPKKRGRPLGSKNKPKVINGHNGEVLAQSA